MGVLVWSEATSVEEERQIEELSGLHLKNADCYVDTPTHARGYPYGYRCVSFRLSANREKVLRFDGLQDFPEHDNRWDTIKGDAGQIENVIRFFSVPGRNGRWNVGGMSFMFGPRSQKQIVQRLIARAYRLQHCFDSGKEGYFSWEPMHKLLQR